MGGFAFLPAAAAVYAVGTKIKPFSKAKDFLTLSTFDGKRDSVGYKIADGIANAGKSIGWGRPMGLLSRGNGYPGGYPSSTGIGNETFTPARTNPSNKHAAKGVSGPFKKNKMKKSKPKKK